MSDDIVITAASDVTLEWLNRVLTRAGAIETGAVSRFKIVPGEGTWSTNARIRVAYRKGSTGATPTALFLKMCRARESRFVLESEVDYYTGDYAGCDGAPLVACYDARYSRDLGAYHILMADLTATHQTTWHATGAQEHAMVVAGNWHVTPAIDHALTLAGALATLHAYRWGVARWPGTAGVIPSEATLTRYIDHISEGLEPMLGDIVGAVPDAWEATLRAIFRSHPRLMAERSRNPEGFTLVHGDVNPGNVLSPDAPGGETYLIDRQPFEWSLTTWLGASDLAYMMIPWWDEASRRALEMPVLTAYHAALVRLGVSDYTWDELLADYRLCVIEAVYTAVEWCGTEEGLRDKKWIWFPKLQRAMAAFADWRCSELLS